jgi:spermidine synthase
VFPPEKDRLIRSGRSYSAALALVLLSGAAALAHQIIWVRLMVDALGAGAGTFARVTGAFFLGLSLGAWFASRFRPANGWRAAAVAEGAVGLLAGAALVIASLPLLSRVPPWLAGSLEWGLPFALILPPAFGMGVVLPWILGGLPENGGRATRLYAVNTAGAVLGIVLVVAFALPALGLRGASLAAMACNGVVALGLWMCSGRGHGNVDTLNAGGVEVPREAALAAFASGFLILGQEVILQHQFAQVTINSLFSGAVVLGFVLVVLAVAAACTPALLRRVRGDLAGWAAGLAALACVVQPFLFVSARDGLKYLSYELSAPAYFREIFLLGVIVVVPVMLFAGMIFPSLLVAGRGNAQATGRLLAWNGLGGLCGAELTNLFVAPAFGLWQGMMVFGVGYLALFALRCASRVGAVLAIGVVVALWYGGSLPQAGLVAGERLAAVQTGREGVVGVIRKGADDWRILFNNTYTLGGSKAQYNQERQAHLPLLLHGGARSVATLGVATGSTLAGAALHSGVEKIDAIELSPLAARYAREYFSKFNRGVFDDPRVRLVLGDARPVVERNPGAYDVVIGDLFLPWRTGEGRLFSREHFENVRRSVKPNGLFCQWLPLFQLTRGQYEMILRTFLVVFPDAFLIRGDFYRDQPIVGLVGGRRLSELNWQKLEADCRALASAGEVADPLVSHAEGVAMLMLGEPPAPPAGALNTLANAALEWNAGCNIIGLARPWFTGDSFLDYAELADGSGLPEPYSAARQAGQKLARLRQGDAASLLPASVREDPRADWTQWPGRPKPFSQSTTP